MQAKIDKNGMLNINRAGTMKIQDCPMTTAVHNDGVKLKWEPCGDWCPLFGEPVEDCDGDTILILCKGVNCFKEFKDEREVPSEEIQSYTVRS